MVEVANTTVVQGEMLLTQTVVEQAVKAVLMKINNLGGHLAVELQDILVMVDRVVNGEQEVPTR